MSATRRTVPSTANILGGSPSEQKNLAGSNA